MRLLQLAAGDVLLPSNSWRCCSSVCEHCKRCSSATAPPLPCCRGRATLPPLPLAAAHVQQQAPCSLVSHARRTRRRRWSTMSAPTQLRIHRAASAQVFTVLLPLPALCSERSRQWSIMSAATTIQRQRCCRGVTCTAPCPQPRWSSTCGRRRRTCRQLAAAHEPAACHCGCSKPAPATHCWRHRQCNRYRRPRWTCCRPCVYAAWFNAYLSHARRSIGSGPQLWLTERSLSRAAVATAARPLPLPAGRTHRARPRPACLVARACSCSLRWQSTL